MNTSALPIGLIVNADDYGYFRCVSRGILECASQGIVTATGVIANRADLETQAADLKRCPQLDAGVHLNLTWGEPLTPGMREKCARWSGRFPGKYPLVGALLSGAIRAREVEAEWSAQIDRCLAAGLELRFLNSHEHVHMLPALFGIAAALARRHGIAHLRFTTAERPARLSPGALVRGLIVGGLQLLGELQRRPPAPRFRGLEPSGRLDLPYLQRMVRGLQPGRIYELMCHPGQLDRSEVDDPRLLGYHDWDGERSLLTSPAARALLDAQGIRLLRYRDLAVEDGQLVMRPASP